MLYCNRAHAGEELAAALRTRSLQEPLVLAINRGGVLVAIPIARALSAELGFVPAMKLRAPYNPEISIGAVTADGFSYVDEAIAMAEGVDERYLSTEKAKQVSLARQHEKRFGGRRDAYKGRSLILVHDGIATATTAIAAIRSVRAAGAASVLLASPVALPSSLSRLRREADGVLCLREDPQLFAVGEAYGDFQPIDDAQIDALLRAYRKAREALSCGAPTRASSPKLSSSLAPLGFSSRRALDGFERPPLSPGGAARLSRSQVPSIPRRRSARSAPGW